MKLHKFSRKVNEDDGIWIAPEEIIAVRRWEGETLIWLKGIFEEFVVNESVEEVLEVIKEYWSVEERIAESLQGILNIMHTRS